MLKEEAKRGARVRCIDADFVPRGTDPWRSNEELSLPKQGQVYTLRGDAEETDTGEYGVYLLEVQNRTHSYGSGNKEVIFSLKRFEVVM